MDREKFVNAMKAIHKSSMKGLLRSFENPPGRSPLASKIRISHFLKRLNDEDREIFLEALEIASIQSLYNFFLVLDGLLTFEPSGPKGQLELIYDNGTSRILLNDPDAEFLSTLFKTEESPEDS